MSSRLGQLWQRHVTRHLDAVDAERSDGPVTAGAPTARTEALVVFVVGALVLAAMSYAVLQHGVQHGMAEVVIGWAGAISTDLGRTAREYVDLIRLAMWTCGAIAFYVVIPGLVIRVVLKRNLSDFGLNLKEFRKHLPIYALFFAPVAILVLVVAAAPDFQAKYPFYRQPKGPLDLVAWEFLYMGQFFALEFFFRGFLVHGLKRRLGSLAAFAMVAPYVMIHFGKPLYETIGAVIAGSVLGVLSLRTGSIAGGVAIHCAVAVMMDMAAMAHRGFPW